MNSHKQEIIKKMRCRSVAAPRHRTKTIAQHAGGGGCTGFDSYDNNMSKKDWRCCNLRSTLAAAPVMHTLCLRTSATPGRMYMQCGHTMEQVAYAVNQTCKNNHWQTQYNTKHITEAVPAFVQPSRKAVPMPCSCSRSPAVEAFPL